MTLDRTNLEERDRDVRNTASTSLRPLLALSWQSLGYGLGIFGRQLINYLTLPLFTNHMPQTEFGLVSFAISIMAFVNTLTNAGLPAATYRFYHEDDNPKIRRRVLGSALWMFGVFALIPALGFLLLADLIAQSFLGDSALAPIIRFAAALLVVDTLVNYGYILLRLQIRPLATSLSNVFIVAAQMSCAWVLVYLYDLGAIGYLAGLLLGEIVGLGVLVFLTRRIVSLKPSREAMGALLRYGLPLLPAALSMWALHLADRALIGSMVGLDQLAVYEIGYKIGNLVSLAIAPFRTAWPPFAFAIMGRPRAQRIYRDILTYLLTLSLLFALGLLAFKSEILSLLAPATYAEALSVVGWIALGQVFHTTQMVLSIGPKISKRTADLAMVNVVSAAISLLLNFILIPRIGVQGSAIAAAVGYGSLAIGSYLVGQRSYPFSLDWARLLKVFLAAAGSYLLISVVDQMSFSGWQAYLGKGGAWFSFIFFSLCLGLITPSQLRRLWCSVTQMLYRRISQLHGAFISDTISMPKETQYE